MAFRFSIRTRGLRELIVAADTAGGAMKILVREGLRRAAEPVRARATELFTRYDVNTAEHYGISVRRVGRVDVEQRLRKVTGKRPDYGALQMRKALLPALEQKSGEAAAIMEAEAIAISRASGLLR